MWKKILGQSKVIENLKSVFKSNKIAHAYLFHGTDGVGKDAAAVEYAKLLNCLNPINNEEACDKCESCIKISEFRSEYFHFICALPSGKSEQTDSDPIEKLSASDFENYLEQLKLKSLNPYHRVNIPNANNIRINSIRELTSKIYLSAGRKTKKVFLISEADKMKQEASNALLKVLEEPPRNSVIILTTSKINTLPQTVVGRCQKIYFEPLPETLISDKLTDLNNSGAFDEEYTQHDITLASKLSGGSYSRAASLLKMGIENIRKQAITFLVAVLKDNYAETVSIVRSVSSKNDKEKVKYFLFFLSTWFNDLLKIRNSGAAGEIKISNFDVIDRVSAFNKNFPLTDLFNAIIALEEAEKLIYQNVQLQMILLNLSFKLKRFIKPA